MDLIREYEFDALPYIDKDYDEPVIREAVRALVAAEMRSFAPRSVPEYLAASSGLRGLPDVAPLLMGSSRSAAMESELTRISNRSAPAPRLDVSRYDPATVLPTGALEKDAQAWRHSLAASRVQLELQASRLVGLEVAEARGGPVWLHHNNHIDATIKYYTRQAESVRSRIEATNMHRKASQEAAVPALARQEAQRVQAVAKCSQIQAHCRQLEAELGAEVAAEVQRALRQARGDAEREEATEGAAQAGSRRARQEEEGEDDAPASSDKRPRIA